jgi:hypothetical protein
MKNRVSVTARTRATIAAAIFSFAISASAADLAPRSQADFRAIADSNLLVLGPVDAVEPSKAQVRVLGQWIPISDNEISQNLDGLIGHVLAAYGSIASDGSFEVTTVREENSVEFVAGATRLYLKGSIAALDALHGTARIGSLTVSYTDALHTLVAEDLSVGAVVSFSGLQFAGTNKLFADNGLVHQLSSTLGQTGSGTVHTLGQTGSGTVHTLGQTGSGTVHTLGQTGSGTVHTLGQTGSGTVHALGQTGSGTVHTLGQTGSGTVHTLGQTGNGTVHTLGQTGSGTVHTLGQTGSGTVHTLGQTGSGTVHTLGQTGSGTVHTLGQTGSGTVHTLGQTGSGTVHTLGQTGSGTVHALGQTGSGTVHALGQTGSGTVHTLGQTGSG